MGSCGLASEALSDMTGVALLDIGGLVCFHMERDGLEFVGSKAACPPCIHH